MLGYSISELVDETLYLTSIPGMAESLIQGKESSLEDCLTEGEIE